MADPIKSPFNDAPHEGMEHKTDPRIAKGKFVADDVLNAFKNWGLDAASALPEAISGAVDLADQNMTGHSAMGSDSWADHIHEKSRDLLGGGNVPDTQKTPEGNLVRLLNPIDPVKAAKAAKILAGGATAGLLAHAFAKGELTRAGSKAAQIGAVKLGGGNWDSTAETLIYKSWPEYLSENGSPYSGAVASWAKKKLGDYVKKEMATPDDPIRKLAEQGITHLPEHHQFSFDGHPVSDDEMRSYGEFARRIRGDNPAHNRSLAQVASSPRQAEVNSPKILSQSGYVPRMSDLPGLNVPPIAAKNWEDVTDFAAETTDVGDIKAVGLNNEIRGFHKPLSSAAIHAQYALQDTETGMMPGWVNKVPDETLVHTINRDVKAPALGFNHIIETVARGLESGKIDPAKLDKLSVADAVRMTHDRHVAELKEAERQSRLEQEKQGVHKFDDGSQWVQLTKPGQFARESDMMSHSVRGYEPEKGHEDWIPASGNSGHSLYGHGGYEGIKSGKAEVYSLRDPSNQAGVTIETRVAKPSSNTNDFNHPQLEGLHEPLTEALGKILTKDEIQNAFDYFEGHPSIPDTEKPKNVSMGILEFLDNYDEGIPHEDVKDVVERCLDDAGISHGPIRGVLKELDNYVKGQLPTSNETSRAVTQVKPSGNYTHEADPEHTEKIIEFLNSPRFKNFIPANLGDLKMMGVYPIRGRGEEFDKRMATLKRLALEDPDLKSFWNARPMDKENVVPIGNIQYMANKLYTDQGLTTASMKELEDLKWLIFDSRQ